MKCCLGRLCHLIWFFFFCFSQPFAVTVYLVEMKQSGNITHHLVFVFLCSTMFIFVRELFVLANKIADIPYLVLLYEMQLENNAVSTIHHPLPTPPLKGICLCMPVE